jgi:hypothetical protein
MSPALLLLLLLATLSAAIAHLLWGRKWLQIPLYWIAACAGCLIAYAASFRIPIPLRMLYPAGVPVLEAVLLAWILMFIASRVRV